MTPTDLKSLLLRDEGCRPYAYQDSQGYWTIGVGRMIDHRQGGGLSPAEIDTLLNNDIARVTGQVTAALPWVAQLDPVRSAVVISMAFQMGIDGLLKFVNTLAAIRDGKYDEAAQMMLESQWSRQTPQRAERDADMMRTGVWE